MARRNPDDSDLLRNLKVDVDDDPRQMRGKSGEYIEVRVFDQRTNDYVAIFTFELKRKHAYAVDIQVPRQYRRRGVASWVYRWVEDAYKVTLHHSKDQTADGKAFQRGRRNPIYRRNFRVNARKLVRPSDTIPLPGTSYKIYIYEVPAPLGGMMMRAIVKDGKTAIGDVRLVDDMDAWVPESAGFKEEYRGKGLYMKTLQELADWMGDEIKPSTVRSDSARRAWEKFGKRRVRPRA